MTTETKTAILEVVDHAALKLNLTSKGSLYLAIQEALERHTVPVENDDWLEAAKPQVRIHRAPNDCQACEA